MFCAVLCLCVQRVHERARQGEADRRVPEAAREEEDRRGPEGLLELDPARRGHGAHRGGAQMCVRTRVLLYCSTVCSHARESSRVRSRQDARTRKISCSLP